FENQTADKQTELAYLIQRVRQAQLDVLHCPDYNLMLMTGPKDTDYHWRVMIIPKISTIAGLERSTDLYVNVVPPEISTEKLSHSMR
ncbi:hypothetical protein KAH55_02435, partial [bacterium]|nr:hypothetical protein [bacterium]